MEWDWIFIAAIAGALFFGLKKLADRYEEFEKKDDDEIDFNGY